MNIITWILSGLLAGALIGSWFLAREWELARVSYQSLPITNNQRRF